MIEELRRRLDPTDLGGELGDPAAALAAVAAILWPIADRTEILLIERTARPGDPWSGHIALPGGKWEPGDPSGLATAIRETQEEIGLDLATRARLLGRLADQPAYARGRRINMVVRPYVFELLGPPPPPALSDEVQRVLWGDLQAFRAGRADTEYPYSFGGETRRLPGYAVEGAIVWGLTHRVLTTLLELGP